MDITTEAGALFDNHPRLKNKALLLDITIVNPCVGSNLGNEARHVGKHLADAVERKKNKYRGSFPATYSLLPLAMSTCGDVGSDVHALIKELAVRRVQHRSETSNESQHLAEGKEVARLRRRFSFVLQQALSFRTRHHLCRQGVMLTLCYYNTIGEPAFCPCSQCFHLILGGLSLSDESFPNEGARGAFAKPSRSVSSRRLRGASKAPPRIVSK